MPDRKEWPDDNIKDNWNSSDCYCSAVYTQLIKPLTAYYNWSKNRREADKKNK